MTTLDAPPPPPRPTGRYLRDHIADVLRHRIASGEFGPDDHLPAAKALARVHDCSERTVNWAIGVLRSEGLVESRRGAPAKVLQPPARQPIDLSAAWTQEQKDLVLAPRAIRCERGAIELTSGISIDAIHSTHAYDRVRASADLAKQFGIEVGTTLMRRRYEMRQRDTGIRLALSVSYIPLALIEGYPPLLDDSYEPWPGGHQHQLYTVGIEVGAFERTIISVPPTADQQDAWGLRSHCSMLLISSVTVDIDGRPVEISDAEYPGDRWKLVLREELKPWPPDHPRFDPSKGDA